MSMNSKQLWAEREALAAYQAQCIADGREHDAIVAEGQLVQLDKTIATVLDEEDSAREAASASAAKASRRESLGARALGPRDQFRGLSLGWCSGIMDTDPTPAVVTMPASPQEIDLTVPAKPGSLFRTFASTLADVPAAGDVTFLQRSAQVGAPAAWAGVVEGTSSLKAQVQYTWKTASAHGETVAGFVPVSKDTLADYDELMAIIEGDLVLDVEEKVDALMWAGTNSDGIVGITNVTGIQTFEDGVGGLYFEALRKMKTKVMKNARRMPNTAVVSPEIKEAMDLYKTQTGLYQSLAGVGNGWWDLDIVEDANADGILVYDRNAALRRTIHGMEVSIGYVDDQFARNELSILAEVKKALQVRYPDAFCYAEKDDLDAAAAASDGEGD